MPTRAAISEIVASLILLVIAVSLGAVVVVWASNYSGLVLGGMAENIDQARYSLMEVPVIEHAILRSSHNVSLWVSNEGSIDLDVDAIYVVNDTVMGYYNRFYVRENGSYVLVDKLTLKPTQVAEIMVNQTEFEISRRSTYVVSVITSSGNRATMTVIAV